MGNRLREMLWFRRTVGKGWGSIDEGDICAAPTKLRFCLVVTLFFETLWKGEGWVEGSLQECNETCCEMLPKIHTLSNIFNVEELHNRASARIWQ